MVVVKKKADIERMAFILDQILGGLKGSPFSWGQGQQWAWVPVARELGLDLLTINQISKRGYRLKRGVQPVGKIYLGSPIGLWCNVYLLQIQCVKLEDNKQLSLNLTTQESTGE
ncbi:hypothetical protein [Gloeothece verrucosa]|uniref:Uncharacterized protein n=1 Tax=Gloeothece verrucosa (strain PCC 7822) TaxID=497965 RepID=E0U7V1_GLOV7|nr:hypothetical protein [Gloeothece verrucosa]ADN16038.1 hypothetical protein Cyan7822_4118 [Gloeothece verrucosa PCC 7822]